MNSPRIVDADAASAPSSTPPPEAPEDQLAVLFRLWLREQHVHPLVHLVRRFRALEKQ